MTTPMAPVTGRVASTTTRPDRRRRKRQHRMLFLLPAAVFLALFSIYPLVQLLRMAFSAVTSATLNAPSWAWVGLDNFATGFESGDTQHSLRLTVVFVVIVTVLGMLLGLAAAIALRTKGSWSGFLLGLMVFVWALPPVVNGSVWKFLLGDNGLVNMVLTRIGLSEPIPFLYDQYWALMAVAFVNSFAVIPFNALVYRAALMNIETEVFEAAALDGANRWQEIRFIMVPSVRATTLVLLVLTIVYGFRSYDFIYVMTYGGPGTATNTLPFLGYLQAFVRYDFGLGSATSVVTVLGVLVLAAVYARSISSEEKH